MTTVKGFEVFISDHDILSSFIKTCDGVAAITDTALVKVNKRGLYILGTDFREMAVIEGRLVKVKHVYHRIRTNKHMRSLQLNQYQNRQETKFNLKNKKCCYSCKIFLPELIIVLKNILKRKHQTKLIGYIIDQKQLNQDQNNEQDFTKVKLFVQEIISKNLMEGPTQPIQSLDFRSRTYYKLSTTTFKNSCGNNNFIEFYIINGEISKIISALSILAGVNVCESKIIISPFVHEPNNEHKKTITFTVKNDGGIICKTKIHANCKSRNVKLLNTSKETKDKIELDFFLTYLNKASQFMSNPQDHTKFIVSEKGLMLQTDVKEGCSIVMYTIDNKHLDLKSYC